MKEKLKNLGHTLRKLRPGQRIDITLPKDYIIKDLELLKSKIACAAKMRPECFTIHEEIETLPTDISGIEIITYTHVFLVRTDSMSAIDFGRGWYKGQWLRDLVEYCELVSTITDPEPNEIPKFHL